MIKMNELVLAIFLFFLLSTGIYLLFINIGLVNTNLSEESKQDLSNLQIYNKNNENPFLTNTNTSIDVNYSLTAYSTAGDFGQENTETKGAIQSIMNIWGDNKLTAIKAPVTLFLNFSPLPKQAFNWAVNTILGAVGVFIFISAIAAWKAGVWGK